MLLARADQGVPVADRALYDTPIPYYRRTRDRSRVSRQRARLDGLGRRRVRVSRLRRRGRLVPNPFYSALALIGNLGSLAVLYLLLSAEFVAAAQVLVYAGAVMVMFLFVIAYIGGRTGLAWAGGPSWQTIGAVARGGAILVEIVVVIGLKAGGWLAPRRTHRRLLREPEQIGRLFLTNHLLAFEITSIVLLDRSGRRRHPRRALAPRRARRAGARSLMHRARRRLVPRRRRVPVRHRRARRAAAAKSADRAALARDHAQRRKPRPDRVLTPAGNGDGQIFALAVMAVAASEVVVGLGLIVALNRRRLALDVDQLSTLRG